jgi:dynactin 1
MGSLSFYREFEEAMDDLQNDIEHLEREKGEMKKRLDAYSKKSLLADLARHASSSSSIAAVVAGTEVHADLFS